MTTSHALLLAALIGWSPPVEHAKITLDVESGGEKVSAFVDQTPPDWGKNPRPVLKVRAGAPIRVQWVLTNEYPHKTLENAVVRFFVAREEKAGQHDLPDTGRAGDVVLESIFEMDFQPKRKAGQRHLFRIDRPGAYLLRVETRQTQSDHEHFAAVDLVVEGEKP